jgi:3-deoxy-D-manno-octulosonic-acid transferase
MSGYRVQKTIYNRFALPVSYGFVRAAAPFHKKLRDTIRGREAIRDRWRAAGERMAERPLWFHVASVGEYEQARPLIAALKETHPDIPVALSVTSPSGHRYISKKETIDARNNIQFVDYLPFDFAENARFCVATLDPRLLVFVKFDLWPNLVWEAAARGTPMVIVDATLSETSKRNTALGKRFYRAVYSKLDKILAISEADARRFLECVPAHRCVLTVGDTRFDRVMERKRDRRGPTPKINKKDRLTVIAGSTWPKDETHLLGALARLAKADPGVLLVVAPHEPARERVESLLSWANREGLRAALLSEHEKATTRDEAEQVVIVDSVGVLAEIYEYGDIAYVGGSFTTGVHNVIEPAVMGIPVLFGPVHENSFEALQLIRHHAAIEVNTEAEIFDALGVLVKDRSKRTEMGKLARQFVESELGATQRCLEAIREYL